MHLYRTAVLVGLAALIALFVAMSISLLFQLRDLQTSEGESMQWSITQVDTELASFHAALSTEIGKTPPDIDEIKLRLDIVLNRLDILQSGRAAAVLSENARSSDMLAQLLDYANRIAAISDKAGDPTSGDLDELLALTQSARPLGRQLALSGLRATARQAEVRRAEFAQQLRWTGSVAIALLLLMVCLLLVLNTMLKRADARDRALLISSRKLASTVSASLDAIIAMDEDGKIVDFNEAAEDMFGWSAEEILGRDVIGTIIPSSTEKPRLKEMAHPAQGEAAGSTDKRRHEISACRKTGEAFPVELNITSFMEEGDLKFVMYLRDITARKANEQKLIDARVRAEQTDRAKSKFLTIMSHEMRTPLNGVLGVLDLLKTKKLTSEQSRYLDIAIASSEVLLEHVNETLDVTRAETGDLVLVPSHCELDVLIANIADVLRPLAAEKGLELVQSVEAIEAQFFWGDGNRIRQILTNLVGNAIKFTEHGQVSISVRAEHDIETSEIWIGVTDTGPGIPPDLQDRIFDDFAAFAEPNGRQSRGDGLGLAISKQIAQRMGGDISLQKSDDSGSVFCLYLKLPNVLPGETAQATNEIELVAAGADTVEKHILIVEDNAINRNVLCEMLVGMGHDVATASDGLDAMTMSDQSRFDVIFMDISIPHLDGIEVTRRIRGGDGPNRATPIVGVTAHGQDEYRAIAVEAGMSRFHTKPIRYAELGQILSSIGSDTTAQEPMIDRGGALQELYNALGSEKTRSVVAEFEEQLQEFLQGLEREPQANGAMGLAKQAHNLKGAAAMLGFSELETLLAEYEGPTTEQRSAHESKLAGRLGKIAKQVVSDAEVMLDKFGQ